MSDNPAPPPTQTPPDTKRTRFWESSGFKVAVVATVAAVNAMFVRPYITAHYGETDAVLVEIAEYAWLAAFGIQKTDGNSLRWT